MTSEPSRPRGPSNPNSAHRAQAGRGRFILTLCRLAAPVSIAPPDSSRTRPFIFFTSRTRQPDGSERLYLHMGYFETLADAEKYLEVVRRHYPNAFAPETPVELLWPANSEAASFAPAVSEAGLPQRGDLAPPDKVPMTDTQVIRILEKRGAATDQSDVDVSNSGDIALLRPDDTGTRQALKEAVAEGAPVSFAVQLHWSAEPIDVTAVSPLPVFKSHTLYATESRREGRSCYFLRLGFFSDPMSAKQVAAQVLSSYATAAVVPVLEEEVTRARAAGRFTFVIPSVGEQRVDRDIDSSRISGPSTLSTPLLEVPPRVVRVTETVRQPVETSPKRPTLKEDSDSLSESGVRHLRIEVQEHLSGRWKIVRLGAKSSNI